MKAIGMPPSDPRVRQMNDAQWLWCYFNEQQDEVEEAKVWKSRLDYLTWFINYEMAKKVHENDSNNSGNSTPKQPYARNDVHNSTDFEKEVQAASLGYDPRSDMTVEEFLENYYNQKESVQAKEPDLINDSFEDLLASGGFSEVEDVSNAGNPFESADDFITRALMHEENLVEQARQDKDSIGITQEDIRDILLGENKNNGNTGNNPQNDDVNDYDFDPDLDIFEVDGLDED